MHYFEGDPEEGIPVANHSPVVPLFDPSHAHPTKVYRRAAKHFLFNNKLIIVWAIARLLVGVLLVIQYLSTEEPNPLALWVTLICMQAMVKGVCHLILGMWLRSGQNYKIVAFKLSQINQGEEPRQENIQSYVKTVGILSSQINFEALKSSDLLFYFNRISNIFYHILIVCGIAFIYLYFMGLTTPAENYMLIYLQVVIIITLYEYADVYLIATCVVVFFPLLIFVGLVYLVKKCQDRHIAAGFKESLNQVKYKPNVVQGHPQCSICQTAYALDEDLIILKCAPTHHFHDSCLSPWLDISKSCPLCRQPVLQP